MIFSDRYVRDSNFTHASFFWVVRDGRWVDLVIDDWSIYPTFSIGAGPYTSDYSKARYVLFEVLWQ
jgi:hypothetical protein